MKRIIGLVLLLASAALGRANPPTANTPSVTITSDNTGSVGIAVHATYTQGSNSVTDFHIERNLDGAGWQVVSTSGNDFSYSDTSTGSHTVQFKCAASDDNQYSWNFSSATSDSYTVVHSGPTANLPSVTITNDNTGTVGIAVHATYSQGSNSVTDFHIERNLDGAGWQVVSTSGSDYSYSDSSPGGHTVQFRCAASDDNQYSWNFSSGTSDSYTVAYTAPAANTPTITITHNNEYHVSVAVHATYSAGTLGVTDFHIERNRDGAGWEVVSTSGNDSSYVDAVVGSHSVQYRCAVSDNSQYSWTFSSAASDSYTVVNSAATTLTHSASRPAAGDAFTITASSTSSGSGLLSQAIDYSIDDKASWIDGSTGAGTRWEVADPNGTLPTSDTVSHDFVFTTPGTVWFRARAESQGTLSAWQEFSLVIHPSFQIIVDTNTINSSQAAYASEFTADGAWVANSDSSVGAGVNLSTLLDTLNASKLLVSEDLYWDYMGFSDGSPLRSPHSHTADVISGYRTPDLIAIYHEGHVDDAGHYPSRYPMDSILWSGNVTEGGTVNSHFSDQINQAYAKDGIPVLLHGRSFEKPWAYTTSEGSFSWDEGTYLTDKIQDPNYDAKIGGATIEFNLIDDPAGKHLGDAVSTFHTEGRPMFLLLTPIPSGSDYASDVMDVIDYLAGNGNDLDDPNLYVVVNVYGSSNYFRNPSDATASDTVKGAVTALRSYRDNH